MKQYVTADFHYGHRNIIKYCNRPFSSLEEMNNTITTNFNKIIKEDDIVFHIGDWCFRNSPGGKSGEGATKKATDYLKELKGNWVLLKGNHDCLSKDTRIVTKNGLKKYNEINLNTIIPTVNIQKQCVEYKSIEDIQIQHINEAIEYSYRNHSQFIVSKNHNILLEKYNQKVQNLDSFVKCKAIDVANYKTPLLFPSTWKSGNKDYKIKDDWITLLGWILTDCYYKKNKSGDFKISIYQSKPEKVKDIKKLLSNLNLKYNLRTDKPILDNKIKYIKPDGSVGEKQVKCNYVAQEFHFSKTDSNFIAKKLHLKENRKEFPDWLYLMSDRQVQVFNKALLAGNGCDNILWGDRYVLEQVQNLNATHNQLTSIVDYSPNCDYLVFYKGRKKKKMSYTRQLTQKSISYNDIMWDITVPNHLFFVERNGKIMITGNSNNSLKTKITGCELLFANKKMWLTHRPMDARPEYEINIVGHVHNAWKIKRLSKDSIMYNAGVDVHGFKPVLLDKVITDINRWEKNE